MQPPQTEVADLQHQVDGLKLQLTEITVLLTKIITSKTDDVDDAPAPVTPLAGSARSAFRVCIKEATVIGTVCTSRHETV